MLRHQANDGVRFIGRTLSIVDKAHIYVLFVSFMSLLAGCTIAGTVSPLVFAGAFLLLGFAILRVAGLSGRGKRNSAVKMFLFIYCFSIIITCLTYGYYLNVFGVPYESGGTDDRAFETTAMRLVNSPRRTFSEAQDLIKFQGSGTWHSAGYYTMLVASIHVLTADAGFEPSTLNPRLLNGFFLAMTSVGVWLIGKKLSKNESTARLAGYYAGLLPTVVFCSADVYRDVLVGLGMIFVVLTTLSMIERFQSKDVPRTIAAMTLSAICWIVTSSMREELFIFIPVMVGAMVVVQIRSMPVRIAIVFVSIAGVVGALFYIGVDKYFNVIVQDVIYYTAYRSRFGGSEGIGTTIYKLPFYFSYPLRIVYGCINPLPFPSEYLSEDYRRVGTLIWYFSLPFLFISLRRTLGLSAIGARWQRGYREASAFVNQRSYPGSSSTGDNWPGRRKNPQGRNAHDESTQAIRPVAVAFVCTYLLFALITLQARHITMFAPLGAVLVALGIERSERPVSYYFLLMLTIGLVMALMYAVIKLY